MVVVNDQWVFCHVPKNAGTAISRSLSSSIFHPDYPAHVPWRCLAPLGKPGFGFVRNPWHRMVSLFYFLQKSPRRHLRRVDPAEIAAMGFKRWLLEGSNFLGSEPVDGYFYHQPLMRYVKVTDGYSYPGIDRLAHPVLGLPATQRRPAMWYLDGLPPAHIGRVENLRSDMQRFSRMFGFEWQPAPRINVTSTKPADWRREYDQETIEFVEHWHGWDIKVGNYAFE